MKTILQLNIKNKIMTKANDSINSVRSRWDTNNAAFDLQESGLTKREYFAANAPEIPAWFKHTPAPKPTKPKDWFEINWRDVEEKELVRQWQHDGSWDLPEHLKWYQDEWYSYHDSHNQWLLKDEEDRYFQWRTYYAKGLINELNKNQ